MTDMFVTDMCVTDMCVTAYKSSAEGLHARGA